VVAARKRLGETLLEAGVIDAAQLLAALGHQRRWGMRLGQAIVDMKLASEAHVTDALSRTLGYPRASLSGLDPAVLAAALALVPRELAVKHHLFPVAADASTLTVAMADPGNVTVADDLRFRTGRRVILRIAGDREIAEAIRRHYRAGATADPAPLDLAAATEMVVEPVAAAATEARAGGVRAGTPDRVPLDDVLSAEEADVLAALDRVADGASPAPTVVKPERALAALLRLLIRKGVVSEREFLDEFGAK
jgi:hypothetical protein